MHRHRLFFGHSQAHSPSDRSTYEAIKYTRLQITFEHYEGTLVIIYNSRKDNEKDEANDAQFLHTRVYIYIYIVSDLVILYLCRGLVHPLLLFSSVFKYKVM